MSEVIAIVCAGESNVHAASTNGNCATLCGLDGDDPHSSVDQRGSPISSGEKIDCPQCWQIWLTAKRYGRENFARSLGRMKAQS